jgi:glycosyltransferase involved in cell wall biosynthesis
MHALSEVDAHASRPDSTLAAPLAYLFVVREGPTYSLADLAPECELLSQRFSGEFWSYGSYEADTQIGRMRLRVVKDRSENRAVNFFRFARQVLRRARESRSAHTGPVVVTSYDPFKGGLLALWVARRLKGVFVCEVNGVYGSEDNFAHVPAAIWRRVRLTQMRIIGSYVLHRARAVRLLFGAQLRNFVALRSNTIVRQFFALTYTERFHAGPEEPIILAAGFPFMRKGVDVLVEAFLRVAPRHPQWKLVLIGHLIPDQLQARGIKDDQVMALPGLPQEELAKWISRCAILALASRSEAMGRVLLEAAAAGKCRIATRVDGIPTVITDGVDGLLVEKNDVESLAAGLARLMDDKDLRQRLGDAARLRVAKEFSPAAYLGHYSEFITAACKAQDVVSQ